MTSKQISTKGWYMEHREGGHFKFYTVLLTENGVVVTHWGRIGTGGQAKVAKLTPTQARAEAHRTVHSKMSKGYRSDHEDGVAFQLPEADIERACERPDPKSLTLLFDRALRDPQFTGEKEGVVGAYDVFLGRAQVLMDQAVAGTKEGTMRLEAVMNNLEELKTAWAEIEDKHSLAATTLDLTNKMLARAMMAGTLT